MGEHMEKHLNILYITSMYPTEKSPYSGVFITRRIEALEAMGHSVIPYALVRSESHGLRMARKMLHKRQKDKVNADEILTPDSSIKYKVMLVESSILGELLDKIFRYKYTYGKAALKIAKNVKRKNVNVVHAHWLYPSGWVGEKVANKLGVPSVITCHGSDVNVYLQKKHNRKVYLKTLSDASCVEFVSNALMRKTLTLGYDQKNGVIAPNGIVRVSEQRTTPPQYVNEIKKVGFVGSIIEVKRVRSFPDIFSIIAKAMNGKVEFVIVGDGGLHEWLVEECEGLSVKFEGQQKPDKVFEYMRQMDVMILPSKNEGWPCVVLEAQSCGTPVVGSDRGGIPEAVGDERFIVKDGEFFEQRFAERVIQVLDGTLHYSTDDMMKRSAEYTWDVLQSKAVDRYRGLICDGNR